jgi:hypothetical protein
VSPGDNYMWPLGQIPYRIDATMDATDRANLQAAINDYHKKTCIRWVPRTSQTAYVNILRNRNGAGCAFTHPSCYAPNQISSIEFENCAGLDNMVHELGHAACFGHEQDRNDKANYIKDCLPAKYNHLNGGHLYDYRSIMHYPCYDCLAPTMTGVTNSQCRSPNGLLSVLDAEKLNDQYKCPGEITCEVSKFFDNANP